MKNIPTNSLIEKYLPADYVDSYSREIVCNKEITPNEFRNLAFNQLPKWIDWLMNLRNAIVKPFGLDTKSRFTDMVSDKNEHEEIFGMSDRHLDFHVSMWCGEHRDGKQDLRIITVVKYNNWFGRLYFFVIRLFHGIIIQSILKNIERKTNNK